MWYRKGVSKKIAEETGSKAMGGGELELHYALSAYLVFLKNSVLMGMQDVL